MATIEISTVDPEGDEALFALRSYFAELDARFVGGFEPGDALTADAPLFRPPTGGFLVARRDDEVVGCGAFTTIDDETGEIKRMWVSPTCRGEGLGRRLLTALEFAVADAGFVRVVLDTNGVLAEAISMYERSGYTAIERYNDNPYAHHWFAKRLTD